MKRLIPTQVFHRDSVRLRALAFLSLDNIVLTTPRLSYLIPRGRQSFKKSGDFSHLGTTQRQDQLWTPCARTRRDTHVQGRARQRQPSIGRKKTFVPSMKTRGSETAGRRPVSRTDTKPLDTPFVTMSATDSWTLCIQRLHEAAQATDPSSQGSPS